MPCKLTVIRHAESTFNGMGVMEPNVELSKKGRSQAKSLNGSYDLVVCSTLRRCRETLDYSNIKYANVLFTDLCREFMDGNIINHYSGEELRIETKEEFNERILQFKELLKEQMTKYDNIAVVTHSTFLHKTTGFFFKNGYFMEYSDINQFLNK